MPSPATGAAAGAMAMTAAGQASAADPNAVAAAGQAAQGQWSGADASSYYSNYWGGESNYRQILPISDIMRRILRSAACRSAGW